MEAKELRIGNLIIGANDLIGEIFNINISTVRYSVDNELEDVYDNIENIKPIQLTEEWLLRFRFKKINNSMFRNCNWTAQGCWDYIDCKKGFKIIIEKNLSRQIFYVHQLQNLYFALTGEELEIKK